MPTSPSAKDYSRWVLPGRPAPLLKGPFLFAVFEEFIANKLTLGEIHHAFRYVEELTSKYGNRTVFELREQVSDASRFNNEPIRTADNHYISISTQWSWQNFPYVLKSVQRAFNINPLQGCKLTDKMRSSLREAGVTFQEVNG